jgi:hypothetical protein
MRLYTGECQIDEIGLMDCCCRSCTVARVVNVESFIEADKLRRSMWPAVQYDQHGDVVVFSRDETVRKEMRCG